MKSRDGQSKKREEKKKNILKERKSKKKEYPGAQKGRKIAKHCICPIICGSGGSKNRFAKAAGAAPCDQIRDEKLHGVVARSIFPNQNLQDIPFSDHFWKLSCRKSASSCFANEKAKNTSRSEHFWNLRWRKNIRRCRAKTYQVRSPEHFWKLRHRKSARCCGAKHISKLEC